MPPYCEKGRWRFRFVYEGRRYSGSTPKGHNTKVIAKQLEHDMIERLSKKRYTGVMPTVADFAVRFLDYQRTNTKPLTYELHERIVTVHIVPRIGKLKLDAVNKARIADLVAYWRESAAATTTNTRTGVLLRILSLAVEQEILHAAPKVKLLKVANEHPRFLTDAEAPLLLEAVAHWPTWAPMVLVALRTGLRIGELRGLQWGDVSFDPAVVTVQRTDPGRSDMDANSPKSGKPRSVPLTPDAVAALRTWRSTLRHTKPTDYVFPAPDEYRGVSGRRSPRSTRSCSEMMTRATKRAGLVDVGWHTLRHTFASWLVMRGVPMRVVQDLLGHATIKQTERYAHLAPGFVSQAMVASLDVPLLLTAGTPDHDES